MSAKRRTRRERKPRDRITLADVAKIAEVAISTASRAMNDPHLVSPDALQRVKEAISRTGYVPNLLAGGLSSNRSRLVATIIPTIAGNIFTGCVQAITDELAASRYQVMLGVSGYVDSREDDLLTAIISRQPDGLILTGIVHSAQGRQRLTAAGIPVVETWDLTPTPIDMLVGFSHEKVGAATAEYFHRGGRRRPCILSGDDSRARLRNRGFIDTFARLGIADIPVHLSPAPTRVGYGRTGLRDLLARCPEADAVMCGSDFLALGALIEAHAKGIEVPRRVAVMGFGDLDFAADANPSLSTIRIDGAAIGRQAARFILDSIAGRPIPSRVVDVGFEIVSRDSA